MSVEQAKKMTEAVKLHRSLGVVCGNCKYFEFVKQLDYGDDYPIRVGGCAKQYCYPNYEEYRHCHPVNELNFCHQFFWRD